MRAIQEIQLAKSTLDALEAVRERIEKFFDVDRIVLFGSAVRGECDAESDADLLVVLRNCPSHEIRDRITSIILDINLEHGTNLSELIVDRETWDFGLPSVLPIHREIAEEGVRL